MLRMSRDITKDRSVKEMVDEVRGLLKSQGFDRKQIFYEKYD